MIKLQVIGHLGRDCVTNEVNGRKVINFSVAHTERFKTSAGVQQERTTWVECAYWTESLGIAPYLLKGQLVYVEGGPEVEAYRRQDGEPGASLKLRVREVRLLGRAEQNQDRTPSQPSGAAASQPQTQETEQGADDLPF